MPLTPPTDFGYNPGEELTPLTSEAARVISKSAPALEKYAVGQRLQNLEETKASTALLSGAQAGCIAFATISLATLPLAGSVYEIGRNTFELVAAEGDVSDDGYIAVQANADKDIVGAALATAINAANVRDQHRTIFKTDSATPARANGNENLRAAYVAATDTLWIFAADAPGGTLVQGTAPDIALDATATGSPSWSVANLNVSPGAGEQLMTVWRLRIAITAGMISAGSVSFAVPFYSATYFAKVVAYAAAAEKTGTVKDVTDALALAQGAVAGQGVATLTLNGGGGDLAATNIAYLEIWAPAVESISVPVTERLAFTGRLDQLALTAGLQETKTLKAAGTQKALETDDTYVPFTEDALTFADVQAFDVIDYEVMVHVDGMNAAGGVTVALDCGSLTVDSDALASGDENDFVVLRGQLQFTASDGTCNVRSGEGSQSDGASVTQHDTAFAPAAAGPALTSPVVLTPKAKAATGNAANLVTVVGFKATRTRSA